MREGGNEGMREGENGFTIHPMTNNRNSESHQMNILYNDRMS